MAQHLTSTLMNFIISFSKGNLNYINTAGDIGRAGGSRTMEPKLWSWDALQFSTLCQKQGIALPGPDAPLREYPTTAEMQLRLSSTPGTAPSAGSLAALVRR